MRKIFFMRRRKVLTKEANLKPVFCMNRSANNRCASKTILILLLAVVSSGAVAEWINVSTDDSGSSIYADPTTIQKVGNRVKMWVLFDYRKATLDAGDKIMSIKKHEEYDCKETQTRLLYLSKHSGRFAEGKVVYLNDIPYDKWVPVVPGSILEDLWRYACR